MSYEGVELPLIPSKRGSLMSLCVSFAIRASMSKMEEHICCIPWQENEGSRLQS